MLSNEKGLFYRHDFSLSDHTNEKYGGQLLTPTCGWLFIRPNHLGFTSKCLGAFERMK